MWLWLWLALGGAALVAGAVVPVLLHRRPHPGGAAIAARSRYHLLGHHVEVPEPVTHPEAEALLRSARERWHSAGALLASARSRQDFELAEQVAREGLSAVARANALLGLPEPGEPS